jgi:hypothetical protein
MRLPHLRLAGLPVVFALAALTACHATPPTVPPADAAARAASVDPKPPPADMPSEATPPAPVPAAPAPAPAPPTPSPVYQEHAATANPPPPCVCSQAKPRPKHRSKTRPKARESEPQSVGPAPPPATTVVDAEVGRIDGPLTSILGRNVYSPQGEDLGRVVDLLADPQGRVRVAVIDFGGFLGVGTRRIAVDWPLLHFTPAAKDKPLLLTVTREKLQSAPEYKDSTTPRVLMPPAAAPDAAGAGSKN